MVKKFLQTSVLISGLSFLFLSFITCTNSYASAEDLGAERSARIAKKVYAGVGILVQGMDLQIVMKTCPHGTGYLDSVRCLGSYSTDPRLGGAQTAQHFCNQDAYTAIKTRVDKEFTEYRAWYTYYHALPAPE